MTLYNETRRLYQQNRKDDTICQLLIHGAILPSLLVIGNLKSKFTNIEHVVIW
jgi:hypothetical protein